MKQRIGSITAIALLSACSASRGPASDTPIKQGGGRSPASQNGQYYNNGQSNNGQYNNGQYNNGQQNHNGQNNQQNGQQRLQMPEQTEYCNNALLEQKNFGLTADTAKTANEVLQVLEKTATFTGDPAQDKRILGQYFVGLNGDRKDAITEASKNSPIYDMALQYMRGSTETYYTGTDGKTYMKAASNHMKAAALLAIAISVKQDTECVRLVVSAAKRILGEEVGKQFDAALLPQVATSLNAKDKSRFAAEFKALNDARKGNNDVIAKADVVINKKIAADARAKVRVETALAHAFADTIRELRKIPGCKIEMDTNALYERIMREAKKDQTVLDEVLQACSAVVDKRLKELSEIEADLTMELVSAKGKEARDLDRRIRQTAQRTRAFTLYQRQLDEGGSIMDPKKRTEELIKKREDLMDGVNLKPEQDAKAAAEADLKAKSAELLTYGFLGGFNP